MKQSIALPFRQIHLDFHTGPWIGDVGQNFDAREFARTMKKAHVNSVTVFAKCHHGHLYYNTKRPERHPGLKKGLDLLGQQVEALHREGIRAPIYISVQCDEYAADNYPQWIARQPDGKPVGAGPLNAGWQIMDMSSPYQDFLAEQTAEILKLFKPVDGVFFDMCWDQPSLNNYAVEAMVAANLNPEDEHDRAKHARKVVLQYMKRFYDMVRATSRNARTFFNCRPIFNLAEDHPFLDQVEIEALPTGGWGYIYFPRNVRYARTFYPKPYMGMTARFHKSWADFGGLKPYAALEFETSQMLAHGARCSIGDQLHPRGTLDKGAYELIGKVYARVEEREPWVADTVSAAQIGLFQAPPNNFGTTQCTSGVDEGATRMLTQLKAQFDVVSEASTLEDYQLLILPDVIQPNRELLQRLSAYVKQGGALLVTGMSCLNSDGTKSLLPELGIKPQGMSPFLTTYIRFGREIGKNVPPSDHVMYERGVRVMPGGRTQAIARVVEPYFDRSWRHFSSHFQTPGDKLSRFAAATLNGRVAYISYPIFSAFAKHANYPYRLLVGNIIDLLLPEPIVTIDAPTSTEVSVMRQGRRTIVHILHYAPERRGENLDIIEDIVPLHDVPLSLKLAKAPKQVYLAPQRTPVKFEYVDGRVNLRLEKVAGHAMVVFE